MKGKDESIRIFEPLTPDRLTKDKRVQLDEFQRALVYFRNQQWQESKQILQKLLKQNSSVGESCDKQLYKLYLDDIEVLSQQRISENWSGELVFDSK